MTRARHEVRLPDLGLPNVAIYAGEWLVEPGSSVVRGDRLLEVLAGSVTVDLAAPADGVLAQRRVQADERLEVGQLLAIVLSPPPRDDAD